MRRIKDFNLDEETKEACCRLWNKEYPEQLAFNDIMAFEVYLNSLSNLKHYLTFDNENKLLAWAFTFMRDGLPFFAIIIEESGQRKGLGRFIIDGFKMAHKQLFAWVIDHGQAVKVNGAAYVSPIDFYLKNGFQCLPGERLENENISAVKIYWEA